MRELCLNCLKAKVTCYCGHLRPFESDPRFAILAHPRELRNTVGTGRMLHLSLKNSLLIDGHDFSRDSRIDRLIQDPLLHCALLYPGAEALDLTHCTSTEARSFIPSDKKLVLFIVDGTWELARGMINRSANLKALPQLRFTPSKRSAYQFRKQPEEHCLSTLETAHWIIERMAELKLYDLPIGNAHNALLDVFGHMVRQQIDYAEQNSGKRTEGTRGRAPLSKTGNAC